MTDYAGEVFTIGHTATHVVAGDTVDLTGADVTLVEVEVYNVATETEILDSGTMDWNATNDQWEYEWDTTGLEPGTYQIRVRIDGDNWEYRRQRLARNKFPL